MSELSMTDDDAVYEDDTGACRFSVAGSQIGSSGSEINLDALASKPKKKGSGECLKMASENQEQTKKLRQQITDAKTSKISLAESLLSQMSNVSGDDGTNRTTDADKIKKKRGEGKGGKKVGNAAAMLAAALSSSDEDSDDEAAKKKKLLKKKTKA